MHRWIIKFVLYLAVISFSGGVFGAIPRYQAGLKKKNDYIRNGVIQGGEARKAFSFQDLRWAYGAKKGIERLIFEFGDERGNPIQTRPGFFQVNVVPQRRLILVEFSQIAGSRLDQKAVIEKLRRSPHIKKVKMTYDPEDSGLSLQLFVRKNVGIEVFELPRRKKGGRLALDIRQAKP